MESSPLWSGSSTGLWSRSLGTGGTSILTWGPIHNPVPEGSVCAVDGPESSLVYLAAKTVRWTQMMLYKRTPNPIINVFFSFSLSGAGSSPHEDFTLLQLRPAGDRVLPGPQAPPCQQGVRGCGPGPGRDHQPGPESRPQLHRHHRAVGRPGHLHRENTKLTPGRLLQAAERGFLRGTFHLRRDQGKKLNQSTIPVANVPTQTKGRGMNSADCGSAVWQYTLRTSGFSLL